MIQEYVANKVLDAALETGGDFSELFMEDTQSNTISMLDGSVEIAGSVRSHGAGIRVLNGNSYAYAYSADTGEEALLKTARAAAAALKAEKQAQSGAFGIRREYAQAPEISFSEINNAQRTALLREGTAAAKTYSPEITQIIASYIDVDRNIFVCNSRGVWATDRQPRTRVSFRAVASNASEAQTGGESPGYGLGFEAYKRLNMAELGTQAAKTAVTMLHAPQCPAGVMPVVIDGGFGGVILHEACVHSLEATAVSKGNSEFCNMLGKRIAGEKVTAVDDGTLEGEWGSMRIDDEGNPAQRNVLIEKGILKAYLIDTLGSRMMKMPATGSARRQGYSFAPTSRMTNTFIAPGSDDEEAMIRSMGDGLFAMRMGGGSVNPLTGEFNFAVLEGYLVKNGSIDTPVRGATLVGRGAQVLLKIDSVGSKLWYGQGMCGSKSGSIPTNVGQPRIRVSELTVGGKG